MVCGGSTERLGIDFEAASGHVGEAACGPTALGCSPAPRRASTHLSKDERSSAWPTAR